MNDHGWPGEAPHHSQPLCSHADAFSDFTLARQGYPRMAFSACFGGIIFSILLGAARAASAPVARAMRAVGLLHGRPWAGLLL